MTVSTEARITLERVHYVAICIHTLYTAFTLQSTVYSNLVGRLHSFTIVEINVFYGDSSFTMADSLGSQTAN